MRLATDTDRHSDLRKSLFVLLPRLSRGQYFEGGGGTPLLPCNALATAQPMDAWALCKFQSGRESQAAFHMILTRDLIQTRPLLPQAQKTVARRAQTVMISSIFGRIHHLNQTQTPRRTKARLLLLPSD